MVAKYKNTCSRLSLLTRGRVSIFLQIVLAALAVLVQYAAKVSSFFCNLNKRLMALVSHPLILSKIAFAPKAEYTVDLFHHFPAFHSPWYAFASVDLHISPPGLVRTLHPLLQAVLCPPGLIEGASQDFKLRLER